MIISMSVIPQDTGVSLSSSVFSWTLCRKINKAEIQRSVAALETEAASFMAWERRANTLFSSSTSIKADMLLLCQRRGHPLRALGALGSLWMLLLAGCSPRELFCHKNRAAYSLWNKISSSGESQMSGVSGLFGYMANCTAPPERCSLLVLSFASRDGDRALWGLQSQRAVWVALVWHGIARCRTPTAVPTGQVRPKCFTLLQTSLAAAYQQRLRLSAACLMALLSGKMKYVVGQ